MKTLSAILLATALLSGGASCKAAQTSNNASYNFNTEDRHLSGFNAVDAHGSFDVYITQGGTESVKVEAPADIIKDITTTVSSGVLRLDTKNHTHWSWGGNNQKIAVYVTVRDVHSISLDGSGDLYFKEGIHTNRLKVDLTGSGDITGKVDVESLESTLDGSGDIKLSGHAANSKVRVHGSGDFTANSLATSQTEVNLDGSGDARVSVSNKIDVSLNGSGDIYYSGGAKQINTSKHGSGDIHHI